MTNLPSTPPSDDELFNAVVNTMTGYASRGVMHARAITKVTCDDGVVSVVFDPAKVGAKTDAFVRVMSFENMAQLVGGPLSSDDHVGTWFRQHLVRIDTELADGTSLGSITSEELHRLSTEIVDGE